MSKNTLKKRENFWREKDVIYLTEEEKRETLPLWRECFPEDSQEFLDYYYTVVAGKNRIAVIRKNGEIISMLHRNPYRLKVGEKVWDVDYLVAVATKKEERGKGAMATVLTKVLRDMNKEKRPLTFLMPAAEAIYAPYDFTYISREKRMVLEKENIEQVPVQESFSAYERAAEIMENCLQDNADVYTVRDESYVSDLIKELKSDFGSLEFLVKNEKTVGIQAYWGREKREQRLLYAPHEECICSAGRPLIMGRITNIFSFLTIFSLKERGRIVAELEVQDTWIAENNGVFLWTLTEQGSVLEKEKAQLQAAEKREDVYLKTDISQLMSWLMGYEKPKEIWKEISGETVGILQKIRNMESVWIDEVV